MKVAIVHNAVPPNGPLDDQDVMVQVESICAALEALGHTSVVIACTLNLEDLRVQLEAQQPHLVFNLVESLAGKGCLIALVPTLLEALAVPYTGAGAEGMRVSSHKILAKERLLDAGLPTPSWAGPPPRIWTKKHDLEPFEPAHYIFKSVWEHASFNLDEDAVVRVDSAEEMESKLIATSPRLGGLGFAERYIDGREFNLSILAGTDGPEVLPPVEIDFIDFPAGKPKIVDYRAKWEEETFEYINTVRRFDFPPEDAPLLADLSRLALRCWELFDLHGYARVDFRVDNQGHPFILEVNANPCLAPNGGVAAALKQAGISYDAAIARILADAGPRSKANRLVSPHGPGPVPLNNAFPGAESTELAIRQEVRTSDVGEIRQLVVNTGNFTAAEIAVAVELVTDRLEKGPASDYRFVIADHGGKCVGYTCYGLIPCTTASYDLYWIAVDPEFQRHGLGRLLVATTERFIRAASGQRVYIETSLREHYAGTRAFYERCGYEMASQLTDFYAPGDGKATFCKQI